MKSRVLQLLDKKYRYKLIFSLVLLVLTVSGYSYPIYEHPKQMSSQAPVSQHLAGIQAPYPDQGQARPDTVWQPGQQNNVNDNVSGSGLGSGSGTTSPAEPEDNAGTIKPAHTETWIEVDQSKQLVLIHKGNAIVREMVASTGLPDSPTPDGTFELQNRGEWFFSETYQEGGKYWVSFKDWGIYLFHSIPMDRNRKVIDSEAELLGKPASHGCVRLKVEDAQWIYENMPAGTRVLIHH